MSEKSDKSRKHAGHEKAQKKAGAPANVPKQLTRNELEALRRQLQRKYHG